MRGSRATVLLLAASTAGASWGCFQGTGAIGAICVDDNQCGAEQRCDGSVCGQCGDQIVQAGELCFGNSSEESVFGEVADLQAFSPTDQSDKIVGAMVNGECPMAEDSKCWGMFLFSDLDKTGGDLETTAPLGVNNPGTVPQVAQGNFDGQSTQDVALAIVPDIEGADMSNIAVLHNFPLTLTSMDVNVSLIAHNLHAADLNGDGLDDLVVGSRVGGVMSLVFAAPGVGFDPEILVVTDLAPRIAPPADMDGDGDLDLVIVSATQATVGIDLNDGQGSFTPQARVSLDSLLVPKGAEIADFDRDGALDIVVFAPSMTSGNPGNLEFATDPVVAVLHGAGDGSLTLDTLLPGGESPQSGLATDINHDGWIDIVIADSGEDQLPVYLNREGSFPDLITIDVAAGPRTLLLDDFDDDGVDDIIVGNTNGVVAVVLSEN